ncbi:MAG: HlyD family efflux transporter periplasmic adaptor subunit [Saprospiraceae bacterium]|nr:HlyD family efflux transporter periplasmic adaptor subunit [Candidatus Vicinibacter proximus]
MSFEDNILTEDIRLNPKRELNQFIPAPRGCILYSGITMIAIALVLVLIISFVLQYPDVIEGPAKITTLIPPVELFSPQSNKIQYLLIKEGDVIKKGERIAVLNSETDFLDLDTIFNQIDQFSNIKDNNDYLKIQLVDHYKLGILQSDYSKILSTLSELKYYIIDNSSELKINLINKRLTILEKLKKLHQNNIKISLSETKLIENEIKKKIFLEKDGVVSSTEIDKDSLKMFQNEKNRSSFFSDLYQNDGKELELILEKAELINIRNLLIQKKESELKAIIITLKIKIEDWRKQFEIRAEADGIIEFNDLLKPGLLLTQGQHYLTIIPTQTPNPILCYALIPSSGFGRLTIGQEASIELYAYRKEEYGRIKARVNKFTKIPQKINNEVATYRVELQIGDSLITDYNKILPINQNLEGKVQIITNKKRLIQRIFEKLSPIFEKLY